MPGPPFRQRANSCFVHLTRFRPGNGLPAIPSIHHMINRSQVLHSQFARIILSLIRIKRLGSRLESREAVRRHVLHRYACFATEERYVPEHI